MLLNNICESFNAVLKDARDKPILSLMEWIRRYVMTRCCAKRAVAQDIHGALVPYVGKYLTWGEEESRYCVLTPSKIDEYEAHYKGETYVVNLDARTCSCFHWDLTGIPCPHAVSCIVRQRGDLEDYVHEAYSKTRYMKAYEPTISAMPGVKHWEKTDFPEPIPPPYRKMPGRPTLRKRRKEPDEGTSKQVKRQKKSRKCGRCGVLGHNSKSCTNPPTTKEKVVSIAPPRPQSSSAWSKKVRERVAKRKADKAAHQATVESQASGTVASIAQMDVVGTQNSGGETC